MKYLFIAAISIALIAAMLGHSPPASGSAAGKTATVNGVTCEIYAQNPHPTYSSSGSRIVNAKIRFGSCNSAVSTLSYQGVLEKCTHVSWGCLWYQKGGSSGDINGTNDNLYTGLITRNLSASCVDGHYRARGRITIYVGPDNDTSSWDFSQNVSVDC